MVGPNVLQILLRVLLVQVLQFQPPFEFGGQVIVATLRIIDMGNISMALTVIENSSTRLKLERSSTCQSNYQVLSAGSTYLLIIIRQAVNALHNQSRSYLHPSPNTLLSPILRNVQERHAPKLLSLVQ